ncbi:MAG: AAA family ATPase [Coxiellaceae bacterium]|nr:AAA family ATPase [Coxiellaceae bacterium]
MYKEFYHFKENPFNVTADPSFFFSSSQHSEAFSHLQFGIEQRMGIMAVIGEIGTGKTTLCRRLLKEVNQQTKTALILNPSFSDIQLLRVILKDFGVDQEECANKFDLINALNAFLLRESSQGHNLVLIIDEAQNLGVKQLEQVRMLSNLETEKQKLLQIILLGQPELEKKLKLASLRQLNQRIAVRYRIKPLMLPDVVAYIKHRLRLVANNFSMMPTFTDQALDVVYELTAGTPRMINILCDRALLAGFVEEKRTIDADMVRLCAEEVFAI